MVPGKWRLQTPSRLGPDCRPRGRLHGPALPCRAFPCGRLWEGPVTPASRGLSCAGAACSSPPPPQHHSGPQGPHAQQQVSLGTALLTGPTPASDGPGAHAELEGVPGGVLQPAARPLGQGDSRDAPCLASQSHGSLGQYNLIV